MNDPIDRQEAITRIDKIMPSKTDSDYQKGISVGMAMAKIAIKDQPSAQQWTPVTERLPEESGSYLVTVEGSQNGEVFERAVDYADFMFCGGYIDNFDTVNDWIEYGEWHVTAWMPLPEPYRKETEDDDFL